MYLLGKHGQAIQVRFLIRSLQPCTALRCCTFCALLRTQIYEEAEKLDAGKTDWEVYHNKGLCHVYLKAYDEAIECFKHANSLQRHDSTYMQLGKASHDLTIASPALAWLLTAAYFACTQVFTLQENYKAAIDIYLEALEFSPENPVFIDESQTSCLSAPLTRFVVVAAAGNPHDGWVAVSASGRELSRVRFLGKFADARSKVSALVGRLVVQCSLWR
jgi:tetratricopeptide (TPR) repeat protein